MTDRTQRPEPASGTAAGTWPPRTGVAYLGHHNLRHLRTDLEEIHALGCDDVLLAVQEIDFDHFPGKLRGLPPIAADLGLRPVAILWGALNLFGGGRSSQFLVDHPECHQAGPDGSGGAAGCYNHPDCLAHLQALVDSLLEAGFRGYFVDEPPPMDCSCRACGRLFEEWNGVPLRAADEDLVASCRRRRVTHHVETTARHVKAGHPEAEALAHAVALRGVRGLLGGPAPSRDRGLIPRPRARFCRSGRSPSRSPTGCPGCRPAYRVTSRGRAWWGQSAVVLRGEAGWARPSDRLILRGGPGTMERLLHPRSFVHAHPLPALPQPH